MLFKLRFIGLLLIFLLNISLFGQNNHSTQEYANTGGCRPFAEPGGRLSYVVEQGPHSLKCTYYGNSGNYRLASETQYVNGVRHGLQRKYYNTGDLSAKGDYWNGRKAGVWRYPYRPGTYNNIEAYCIEYDNNGNMRQRIPSC